MPLTIVIPCRDDRRILECVRSVDTGAEILVVLNGSPRGFHQALERHVGARVRVETLQRPNRSRALEHGIDAASHDRVLLMDSDCIFRPGAIDAMDGAFDRGAPVAEVYKGVIVFDRGSGLSGRVVARSRSQRMGARLNAYKPPLALSRLLRASLGGYFFDPRLVWKEDADFDRRVRQAGIRIVPVGQCVIHHAPLSLTADLTSSFRYGMGAAIARHLDIPLSRPERSVLASLLRDGPEAALYMVVANQVRVAGYVYGEARLRLSGGRWLTELAGA